MMFQLRDEEDPESTAGRLARDRFSMSGGRFSRLGGDFHGSTSKRSVGPCVSNVTFLDQWRSVGTLRQ